jgi:IS5 family transposase
MLGARTFPGNPYDDHILSAVLEQATNLTQDIATKLKHIVVDLGFRGVDADNPGKEIIHRGKFKSLSKQQKGWLKRRTAVEPAIGHLKSDHRMDRCWLQGALGAALSPPHGPLYGTVRALYTTDLGNRALWSAVRLGFKP